MRGKGGFDEVHSTYEFTNIFCTEKKTKSILAEKFINANQNMVFRAGIHEGPSRYRDHKANRPNSFGPLTCSEKAVFMKAGQQGPQLLARVYS